LNIFRLVEKILIRVFLIVSLIPLQSCSNTLIGERLETSFDINDSPTISGLKPKEKNKLNEKTNIKSITKNGKKDNEKENLKTNITNEISITNKDRFSKKSTKQIKTVIFNPQPYRIILKLSGANPSAPAETVTKALRKAGVQFEVEKIERVDEENLLKTTSLKR